MSGTRGQQTAPGEDQEIWAGILRVELSKQRVMDPEGDSPACKNAIGTATCQLCGQDVYGRIPGTACPDVPASERWRAVYGSGVTP